MNKLIVFLNLLAVIILLSSCGHSNPNVDQSGEDEFKALEIGHQIDKRGQAFQDVIYVPIYSDIYVDQQNPKTLLAATLSIRNTSFGDSLIVSKIEYFNTGGELVRSYIENPISLPPMATVNYVIEKDDDTGGAGANFIIELSSKNRNVNPLIQAIMVGQSGNKGFSFATDGYSINK